MEYAIFIGIVFLCAFLGAICDQLRGIKDRLDELESEVRRASTTSYCRAGYRTGHTAGTVPLSPSGTADVWGGK